MIQGPRRSFHAGFAKVRDKKEGKNRSGDITIFLDLSSGLIRATVARVGASYNVV